MPPLPVVLRHPLFNLDGEHMIVELGLKLAETPAQLPDDILSEGKLGPVLALPEYAQPTAHHVEVNPPARSHF
jgi:hypothetical protein